MSSEHIETIVETLSQLSVLDMAKLKTLLEEKWGVKAATATVAAAPAAAAAAPVAESTEFKVVLEGISDASKKIAVIKAVREVTSLGLKEAKDLVDGAPQTLKESTSKADAELIKKKLEEAGAKVSTQGL